MRRAPLLVEYFALPFPAAAFEDFEGSSGFAACQSPARPVLTAQKLLQL